MKTPKISKKEIEIGKLGPYKGFEGPIYMVSEYEKNDIGLEKDDIKMYYGRASYGMYYNISYGGNTLEEINTDFRHKVDDLIDKIREESNEGLNIFNSEVLVGIIESLDRPIQTKEDVAKLICECVSCENCPVLLCSTDPYYVSSDGKLKHNVKSAGDTSVDLDNVEQRYCIKRLEDWITGGKPKTPINEPKTIKESQFD